MMSTPTNKLHKMDRSAITTCFFCISFSFFGCSPSAGTPQDPSSTGANAPSGKAPSTTPPASTASRDDPFLEVLGHEPEAARQFRLGGRGPDFAPSVTREMYNSLPEPTRRCSKAILNAQLQAIRETANDATKSFHNCANNESRAHLQVELRAFEQSVDAGLNKEATRHLGAAMAALHAFYAHTNFVELLSEKMDWSEASGQAFEVWKAGSLPVDTTRLMSDYRESAHPSKCGAQHPQLDKSSNKLPAGQVLIKAWGFRAHEAAVKLALDDSGAMLKYAWRSRPRYAEACGQNIITGFVHGIIDYIRKP